MFDQMVLGIIGINVILTVLLIYVYFRNHQLVKSKMTLGMLFFALAFLIENALSLFFYNSLLMQGITYITTFNLVVKFFEMIGLLVLLYVTWE
ncbi:MAG: hypothetical protein JSV63_00090 [Candidatus Aenigmatarchaeota archaeon]|nr:MAG: hypothetical protein JSV63_00090 [Candidatus Aenigmarchaeota archaeon]